MQVTIEIPQAIINTCIECELNNNQTKAVFLEFMKEVMNDPYCQFENDFDNWINGDAEDYINEIADKVK